MRPLYDDSNSEILPALRELFSQHPAAAGSSPEILTRMLHVLCYLNHRPGAFEVEAALEALRVEGELAA